jgi:hypothetical protein
MGTRPETSVLKGSRPLFARALRCASELTNELTTELNKKAPNLGLNRLALEPKRWWAVQDLNL